jgi:hypothetical protein
MLAVISTGCELSQTTHTQLGVSIAADGKTRRISVTAGTTVGQALAQAGITPGSLDRAEPPFYAVLRDGDTIRFTRVEEKFRTETQTIPFQRQVLRNESLPEGQERLVQAGVNGEQEITYRDVFEEGVQTSETVIKTVVLKGPVDEIMMIGSQSSFAPVPIPGRITYLAAGNAWLIDTSTANRRLLVNTGDLDGQVFALSPDGGYLLFTRKSTKPPDQEINTLWAIKTQSADDKPISLNASNVLHFAAWYPDSANKVAYSTVEPRATAPGWQANNDLYKATVGGETFKILDARSGGIYGWWGMGFAFSPNARLAYSGPDGIGLVSQAGGYLAPLVDIIPLQTHGDWAWTPALSWGADSQTLYFVDHAAAPSPVTDEESPFFDLKAISLANNGVVDLAPQAGMFALPSVSPGHANGQERAYQVAYLQAIFPDQSETSRYRLVVMDRDGSNRRTLFPATDVPGLEPQTPVWAPGAIPGQNGDFICVVYQGNLWLIDTASGQARQVTGDGLVSRVDWK